MSGIQFKEFSDEEGRIYEESIGKIKENMKKGMSLDDACNAIEVKDEELKRLIGEDFLKITIAEMHYSQHLPLEAVSKELNVPLARIQKTHRMMIEEVMQAEATKFGSLSPESLGFTGPEGNA
jgi:hypothetical protein